jgi:membrane glycosyltransferase
MTVLCKPALPQETPLSMPRQPLNANRRPSRQPKRIFRQTITIGIRSLLATAACALTAYGTLEIYGVMATGGVTPLQWLFLVAFALTFAWISISACQAVVGFCRLIGQYLTPHRRTTDTPPPATGVLLPVYNEDPVRIAAGVSAMAAGLTEKAPGQFAFFLLSDTNQPDAWIHEEAIFAALIEESPSECPVFYRHRRINTERKAGNIADWVTRWGGAYDAMIVLDADSLIDPETMIEMTRRLSADPGLGLIQTLPGIIAARSLFGRLQQFANRCYGPVFGNGLAAWHGDSSNFWGHNAIIRTRAFAECCKLPHLPGTPPLGGHILSHDFAEAALLRRGGWGVRFDTDLKHSFEEAPPSLIDVLIRDRRWCQGNLQHSRVIAAQGVPTTSRLHMLSGIVGYLSAPLWLMLVVAGLVLAVQVALSGPDYFPGPSLFPIWPVFDSERAVRLFVLATAILLTPKFLGWLAVLLHPRRCAEFGGPVLLTFGIAAEIILSALYAPVLMLTQSHIVWQILRGGDSGWRPQRRGDGGMAFQSALKTHGWHALTGCAVAAGAWSINSGLFLWILPVTGALALAPLTSWLSGSVRIGGALLRIGILQSPEEYCAGRPPILQRRDSHLPPLDSCGPTRQALTALAGDPALNAWHRRQLAYPRDEAAFDPSLFVARAKAEREQDPARLATWLTPEEQMAFLHDPDLVATLPGPRLRLLRSGISGIPAARHGSPIRVIPSPSA